ncbi:gag-protease polyprotein [Trifolium repens]|nr:gag-protease polyprotein [Trifolium repens]
MHGLMSLNMLLSTPLKRAFKALLFPRAASFSSLDHSSSGFKTAVLYPSLPRTTGGSQPFNTDFQVLLSIDFKKVAILDFQKSELELSKGGGLFTIPPSLSILPENYLPEYHPKTGRVPALMPIEIPGASPRMCYIMFQHLRC